MPIIKYADQKIRSFCCCKEERSKSPPKRQTETMTLRQSAIEYIAAKTATTPSIRWIQKFLRLFYALIFYVANHPAFTKTVEAFSNHWYFLHLMSAFLVQCNSQNRLGNAKAAKLAFRHLMLREKKLDIFIARHCVLVPRVMRFLPVFT